MNVNNDWSHGFPTKYGFPLLVCILCSLHSLESLFSVGTSFLVRNVSSINLKIAYPFKESNSVNFCWKLRLHHSQTACVVWSVKGVKTLLKRNWTIWLVLVISWWLIDSILLVSMWNLPKNPVPVQMYIGNLLKMQLFFEMRLSSDFLVLFFWIIGLPSRIN